MSMTRILLGLSVMLGVAGAAQGQLENAYWRFEEGVAGQHLPTPGAEGANPDSIFDSINTNNMTTYSLTTAPIWTSQVPKSIIPRTGAANKLALDFTPNQDIYTRAKPIETENPTAFTLEAAFFPRTVDKFEVIVGKDGKPSAGPEQTLALKIRDDTKQLQIQLFDASNTIHDVRSVAPVVANQWYYAAVVDDGTKLSLWLDRNDGKGYLLQGTTDVAGALSTMDGSWIIGRGMHGLEYADWFDGIIDEVRLSNRALPQSDFLFVPEPACLPLIAIGALALCRRWRSA